jgi:hypothetical protein
VVVEQRLGDTGALGDRTGGGPVERALGEQVDRGGEDAISRRVGLVVRSTSGTSRTRRGVAMQED